MLQSDTKEKCKQGLFTGGMLADAALGGEQGHSIAQQLAGWINTPNVTAYDKAIDSVYLSTHVGGSHLHHLLDGQHDIFGAFKAASQALPNDTLWQEVMGTANHLGKDLFSVSGLPVASIDPTTYAQTSNWLHDNLHISKRWLGDLLQVNGMELFAGMLSAAAVVVGYRQGNVHQLAELSAASGLAGMLSANPIGLSAAAVALILAWKAKHADSAEIGRGLLVGAGTAGAVSIAGTTLAALGLSGGLLPALAGICLTVPIGLYVRNFLSRHLYSAEDTEPQPTPTLCLPQWHIPELEHYDRLFREIILEKSYPISPDISAALNHALHT